jgi:hypothetical protein
MDPGAMVQDAIDELERIVAAAYRPGEGLTRRAAGGLAVGGGLAAHVALSSALLTAYDVSGRLPYSMLAEELMQFARRTLWDDRSACFTDAPLDPVDTCVLNCDAARVLCGLAALHGDEGYRAAAVIRPEAAYADDAARILIAQEGASRESGACRGAYGLALQEWLAYAAKDHIHHRFEAVGLSKTQSVFLIYFIAATLGLSAILLKEDDALLVSAHFGPIPIDLPRLPLTRDRVATRILELDRGLCAEGHSASRGQGR